MFSEVATAANKQEIREAVEGLFQRRSTSQTWSSMESIKELAALSRSVALESARHA